MRRVVFTLTLWVALMSGCACTGDLSAVRGADAGVHADASAVDAELAPPDAEAALPSLAFVMPDEGSRQVRDTVIGEEWAARVTLALDAVGVSSVDLEADGGFFLGTIESAPFSLTYDFFGDGERTVTAIGRDAMGTEVARATRSFVVEPPADMSCHAMLDALGLDWEPLSSLRGVDDPVRVQPLIQGVRFRYVSNAEPTPMTMDCGLAPRLARVASVVREYGIDEVQHIGIYNYRCIGGGDPDSGTCTPSQHAYARAIDLHAFGLADSDIEYSTETDWQITMRADPCPIMSTTEADRVLKEIACRLWSEGIFQIVLTPNYNAAHRNHFHVDLTAGSMYLGAGIEGVDPPFEGLGD